MKIKFKGKEHETLLLQCVTNRFNGCKCELEPGKIYIGFYHNTQQWTNTSEDCLDYYMLVDENGRLTHPGAFGSCYLQPIEKLREEKLNKIIYESKQVS